MNSNSIVFAKLSIQRALLGYVLDNVRAVAFTLMEQCLNIIFYIDGEILEENIESSSCVEAEVIADYDSEYKISVKCLRRDYPSLIEDNGVRVFQRQEPFDA